MLDEESRFSRLSPPGQESIACHPIMGCAHVAWVVILLFFGSIAHAAKVEFGAVQASPPGLIEVSIAVSSEILDGMYEAAVVIGSELPIEQFSYSDNWLSMFSHISPTVYDVGFYVHDVVLINRNDTLLPVSLELGTIALDGSQAEVGEVYRLWVDADQDRVPSALSGLRDQLFIEDPLFGRGTVSFIPEPSTLGLLSLAVPWIWLFLRRSRGAD